MWNYNHFCSPELYHYGVKGMKWGVRRYQNYDGTRINSNRLPELQKGDIVIKKGTQFQRIAAGSNMDNTKGVFLSFNTKDKDLYRGVLGRMRVSWMIKNEPGEVKLKQLTMTANKDIRIPSKATRIEELNKLLEAHKSEVLDLINEGETSSRRSKGYDSNKTNRVDNTMYERFNHALGLGADKHPIILKYYESLRKQGYDAIPDENDIRLSTFKARAPMIFFDTMDSIGSVKVKDLKAGEVFEAYNRSIGEKTVRNLLLPGNLGAERITNQSASKVASAQRQQQKDVYSLNKNYTMTNLATDWGVNRLSSRQIRKVSALMDEGKTHAEASAQIINRGNRAVDKILARYKL